MKKHNILGDLLNGRLKNQLWGTLWRAKLWGCTSVPLQGQLDDNLRDVLYNDLWLLNYEET